MKKLALLTLLLPASLSHAMNEICEEKCKAYFLYKHQLAKKEHVTEQEQKKLASLKSEVDEAREARRKEWKAKLDRSYLLHISTHNETYYDTNGWRETTYFQKCFAHIRKFNYGSLLRSYQLKNCGSIHLYQNGAKLTYSYTLGENLHTMDSIWAKSAIEKNINDPKALEAKLIEHKLLKDNTMSFDPNYTVKASTTTSSSKDTPQTKNTTPSLPIFEETSCDRDGDYYTTHIQTGDDYDKNFDYGDTVKTFHLKKGCTVTLYQNGAKVICFTNPMAKPPKNESDLVKSLVKKHIDDPKALEAKLEEQSLIENNAYDIDFGY